MNYSSSGQHDEEISEIPISRSLTKSVNITTSDLEKAGIVTQLNQSDLVEVCAEEVYNKVVSAINEVNREFIGIVRDIKNLYKNEIEEFVQDLKILGIPDFKKENIKVIHTWYDPWRDYHDNNEDRMYFHDKEVKERDLEKEKWESIPYQGMEFRKEGNYKYTINFYQDKSFLFPKKPGVKILLRARFESGKSKIVWDTKNGIEISSYKRSSNENYDRYVSAKMKETNKVVKRIEEYREKLPVMKKTLKEAGVDINRSIIYLDRASLIQDARLKVNKLLISNQAPEIRKQMEEVFGIKF